MAGGRKLVALAVALAFIALGAWWLHSRVGDQSGRDELTFRTESFSINVFPPTMLEINSRRIATLLNAPLFRIGADGRLKPAVAGSWSDEGLTWRFRLAPGGRFSDGRPITADDVVTSICRSMQPGSSWAWALVSIAQTRDGATVRCDGLTRSGNDVVVRQSFDAPWFEDAMAGPAGWILPRNADPKAAYGVVPGAGRYKVKEIVPDAHVLLEPVDPRGGFADVRFRFIPDDGQAAALMRSGGLSSLYLQSPLLKAAVAPDGKGRGFTLQARPFDRVRVLIINEQRLRERGFSDAEVRTFRDSLDTQVDRTRLAAISEGIADPAYTPLPVFGTARRSPPSAAAIGALPQARLTVISEPDSFSDLIAAALPKRVGPVQIDYRAAEKGALIGAMVKRDFDIACFVLEGPMHSPKVWSSFFEPEGAFVAFGMPVAGIKDIDFTRPDATARLDTLLTREGNWIMLLREKRIDAVSDDLAGTSFTPSGQDDLHAVTLKRSPR